MGRRLSSEVYRAFLSRVGRSPSTERVIDQSGYDGVIDLVSAPAEELGAIPDSAFDVVVSNAVLEHLYDLAAAAREMRRVSKAGAVHSHQVDFRDHRDFARPLEYLLLSRRKFSRLSARDNCEFGCQTRPLEVARIFKKAGYAVDDAEVGENADEGYLDDLIPRLRRAWLSPYKRWNSRRPASHWRALLDASVTVEQFPAAQRVGDKTSRYATTWKMTAR